MKELLEYKLFTLKGVDIHLYNLLIVALVIVVMPFLFYLFRKFFLNKYYKRKQLSSGRVYATNQLIKYVLIVLTLVMVIDSLGFSVTGLWTAGAALLVGVGLGLQQTFNDFASGVILLLEGTVEKGDWIQVGDTIGEVKKIGLRTSLITTRRNISIIVPNSKITVDNVINLSHDNDKVLHEIPVGVAYGSDVNLVKRVLLECASRHSKVLPSAFVRFVDFGDSSLNFQLLFWSTEYHQIEDVKSDLRFMIDSGFRKFNIEIPFPQRDINFRNALDLYKNNPEIEKENTPPENL